MSFSRYAIEKKQVSHDRGVTWEDVTPFETREGALVGTYRTLIECEDAACDLEKTEYTVIDGFLPSELCGDTFRVLPSGIAMRVSWTSGAICCSEWQSARPNTIDRYGTVISHSIGTPRCVQGGYCPSFDYSITQVNGREMDNFCFDVQGHKDWVCPDTLCACFQITEFMPWAEGKTSWKLVQSQHYVREHCSEPWEADGEPNIVGIAERWKFVDETFEQERWVHQVAKTFDDNGNVVEWQSDSTFDYRQMTEAELDPSIELLDYVINDGVICWTGKSGTFPTEMYIQIARDESYSSSGEVVYYMGYSDGADGFFVGTNSADTAYIGGMHLWGAGYNWDDAAVTLTNDPILYKIYSARPSNVYYRSIFCGITRGIAGVNNILFGTKTGKFVVDGETVAFPCRIHENLGQIDDYWNSSQIGYVVRHGDGTMIVMEYVYGKYTNTSGVTQNLKGNTSSAMKVPSDAVDVVFADSVTSLPKNIFSGNTTLTSVTMSRVATIGESAFERCTALESVTFGNTSVTIGDNAFKGSGLKTVSLQNVTALGTAPGQINTGYVFSGCTQLETIEFGTSITYLPIGAFYGCSSLRSINIPSNVTTIGNYSFQKCSSLSSVTISDGVTTISNAFVECTSLKSVEIPSSVTAYAAAFWNCSNLEYVTINTTADIKEYTFYNCNIKEVKLTVTKPPYCDNGRFVWDRFFTFAPEAVILVPASAVDAYKNDKASGGWKNVASMIYPIPNETEWVNIGYACVDGQRYDYEHKRGRNTEYSNDWFWLPEYRTVGEPYGECDGTEPY